MPRVAKKKVVKKAAPKKAAPSGKYDKAWDAASAIGGAAGPMGSLAVKGARGLASLFGYGAYGYRRGAGKMKGSSMFKSARSIRGRGDYSVGGTSGPVAGVPQFSNWVAGANGSVRFQHREYLQDLLSSTTFNNVTYALNPGLASSFPFLSAIASNFEKYRWHGLSFYYRTMSGTAVGSTSTALGTIVMATQYNALASAFQNKAEMENAQGANSGAPCYDLIHGVECAPKETPIERLYVRTGGVPSGADQRLYDLGEFNIAVVGCQSASNNTVGELWVTYDVELIQPKVPSGAGLNLALTDHFVLPAAGISSSAYFSTATTPTATSTIGGTVATSTYTFPANFSDGLFLGVYQVTGASTALTNALAITPGSNIAFQSFWKNDNAGSVGIAAGVTSTVQMVAFTFKFNGGVAAGQSFLTISAGTLPGTITSGDFWITTITPGLLSRTESKYERSELSLAHKIRDEVLGDLMKAGYQISKPLESKEEVKESAEDIEQEIARLVAKRKILSQDDGYQRIERVSEPTTPADFKKTLSRKA